MTRRGRFAPSPTGPLHFGSLVAAAASYLDARINGGEWLVRLEDLDIPRCVAGADGEILRTLEQFGFEWDGPVACQSQRLDLYRTELQRLRERGLVYPCGCNRETPYPGTCRNGLAPGMQARAWRVRTNSALVEFADRRQGRYAQNVEEFCGDFVLMRADGVFAYQLAVVVDDEAQGITDVLRGEDLLDSTPRQIHLQRLLGYSHPTYLHVPIVKDEHGEKLSKRTGATAVHADAATLRRALIFLGYSPPEGLTLSEIWTWARSATGTLPN